MTSSKTTRREFYNSMQIEQTTSRISDADKIRTVDKYYLMPKNSNRIAVEALYYQINHSDAHYGGLVRRDLESRLHQEQLTLSELHEHIKQIHKGESHTDLCEAEEEAKNNAKIEARRESELPEEEPDELTDAPDAIEQWDALIKHEVNPEKKDLLDDYIKLYPLRYSPEYAYSVVYYFHFANTQKYLPFGRSGPSLSWLYIYLFTYDKNNALDLQYSRSQTLLNLYGPRSLYYNDKVDLEQRPIMASQNPTSQALYSLLSCASSAAQLYRYKDNMKSMKFKAERYHTLIDPVLQRAKTTLAEVRSIASNNITIKGLETEIQGYSSAYESIKRGQVITGADKLFNTIKMDKVITAAFMDRYTLLVRPEYVDVLRSLRSNLEAALKDRTLGNTDRLKKLRHTLGCEYRSSVNDEHNHYLTPIRKFVQSDVQRAVKFKVIGEDLLEMFESLIGEIDSGAFQPDIQQADKNLLVSDEDNTDTSFLQLLAYARNRIQEYETQNFEANELKAIAAKVLVRDIRETSDEKFVAVTLGEIRLSSLLAGHEMVTCDTQIKEATADGKAQRIMALTDIINTANRSPVITQPAKDVMLLFISDTFQRGLPIDGQDLRLVSSPVFESVDQDVLPKGPTAVELADKGLSLEEAGDKYIQERLTQLTDARQRASVITIVSPARNDAAESEVFDFIFNTCFMGKNFLQLATSATQYSFQAGTDRFLCKLVTEDTLQRLLLEVPQFKYYEPTQVDGMSEGSSSARATVRGWTDHDRMYCDAFPRYFENIDPMQIAFICGVSYRTQVLIALIENIWHVSHGSDMALMLSITSRQPVNPDDTGRMLLIDYADEVGLSKLSKARLLVEISMALIELHGTARYTIPDLIATNNVGAKLKELMGRSLSIAKRLFEDANFDRVELTDQPYADFKYRIMSNSSFR